MNIHVNHFEGSLVTKMPNHSDFHIARSVFLDAFSELEIVVCKLLAVTTECKIEGRRPFGQRLDELKNLSPNNKLPKDKCAKISNKLLKIYPISIIRSDIVHSRLDIVCIDGIMHAKICNNNMVVNDPTLVRLLNIECFKVITAETKKISSELKQIASQPLTPKTPSP